MHKWQVSYINQHGYVALIHVMAATIVQASNKVARLVPMGSLIINISMHPEEVNRYAEQRRQDQADTA